MSKEVLVFILGIVVFVTPFLGVPPTWKDDLLMVLGVILVLLGYLLRRAAFLRRIRREGGERSTDSFVEHGAPEGEE